MFSQQSDLALYQHHSDLISSNFNSLIAVLRDSQERLRFPLIAAAKLLIRTLQGGNKILICGNGGSASDAQHFAGELAGHMGMDRPALAALALNSDTSVLTAIANDYSYDSIFSRQVEAYGKPGDVLIGISTSGNSENVIQAMRVAREKQMFCIGLLGKNGGKLFSLCDIPLVVPTHSVQHIQEVHTHLIHTLCELIEKQLFVDIPQTTHAPIGMKQGKSLVRVKKPADKGGHEDE
jgi:D-sedoheptulose 7-phosphate isomerase